jgi:urease accessory protein
MQVKLLQLISPTFPVGAFSYSQGLEFACDEGVITNLQTAQLWITDMLHESVAQLEAPLAHRMLIAAHVSNLNALNQWNDEFLCLRETQELRAETLQMGYSFKRIASELGAWREVDFLLMNDKALPEENALSYPCAFAWACASWDIASDEALKGYVWAWCENQVMAAIKAVPLGQTAGQQILAHLAAQIDAVAARAITMLDEDICNVTPGLAIASSKHETQYSRLFRS